MSVDCLSVSRPSMNAMYRLRKVRQFMDPGAWIGRSARDTHNQATSSQPLDHTDERLSLPGGAHRCSTQDPTLVLLV